jgi:hypothetical protein
MIRLVDDQAGEIAARLEQVLEHVQHIFIGEPARALTDNRLCGLEQVTVDHGLGSRFRRPMCCQ